MSEKEKPSGDIQNPVKAKAGGIGKLFDANTTSGRANVAKATYAGVFLTYLYFRSKKKKKLADEKKKSHSTVSDDHDNDSELYRGDLENDTIHITAPQEMETNENSSDLLELISPIKNQTVEKKSIEDEIIDNRYTRLAKLRRRLRRQPIN